MKTSITALALSVSLLALFPSGSQAATAVDLGTAGNYAILAETTITTTAGTFIDGDIAVSPAATSYITGFDLSPGDPTTVPYSTSALVGGRVFGADNLAPTPTLLGDAVLDMGTAYTDAAGRPTSGASFLNVNGGLLNGQTLVAGVYTWGTAVSITDSITFDGGGDPNAVWILQISDTLDLASGANPAGGAQILLSDGAQAQNIFWQVAGAATLGTYSHFEGNLLAQTNIAVETGASVHGNLYAQSAVTLDSNAITQAIPEPTSLALLGCGIVVLFGLRRRRAVRA